jgi:putative transcriptional regulator
MSRAGSRLVEAAKEAAAIARGEASAAREFVPAEIDVKAMRARLKLSQEEFAHEFGLTMNQVRDWEQGRSRPLGGVRTYLLLIGRDPDSVRQLLESARKAA